MNIAWNAVTVLIGSTFGMGALFAYWHIKEWRQERHESQRPRRA